MLSSLSTLAAISAKSLSPYTPYVNASFATGLGNMAAPLVGGIMGFDGLGNMYFPSSTGVLKISMATGAIISTLTGTSTCNSCYVYNGILYYSTNTNKIMTYNLTTNAVNTAWASLPSFGLGMVSDGTYLYVASTVAISSLYGIFKLNLSNGSNTVGTSPYFWCTSGEAHYCLALQGGDLYSLAFGKLYKIILTTAAGTSLVGTQLLSGFYYGMGISNNYIYTSAATGSSNVSQYDLSGTLITSNFAGSAVISNGYMGTCYNGYYYVCNGTTACSIVKVRCKY